MSNMMQFIQNSMRRGANPETLLAQMAQSDPTVQQVQKILRGKSPQQQREIVTNMYRERGVDIDNLARSLGIQIPSER